MSYLKCLAVVAAMIVVLVWYKNSSVCMCSLPQKNSSESIVESVAQCALSESELENRKSMVLRGLTDHVNEWHELSDGYSFQFSGDDKTAEELTQFVLFERKCCGFMSFGLYFEPTGGPIRLELRGGKDVKEYVGGWLESNGLGTSE